jgi:hypothetical protein
MAFNNTQDNDEEFLDDSGREVMKILREWMNEMPIPGFSVEDVIIKMRQTPLILNLDISASKAEEIATKEEAEQIIKQQIMPAVRTTARRTVEKASELIKKAKSSVWVTHFAKERLDDDYIESLLALLKKGVKVTRIVYFHEDQRANYGWLKRFRKDGGLMPGYRELVYKAVPTPLDLVIVDKSTALIAVPMLPDINEFFDAVVVNDSDENHLIRLCRRYFSLLEQDSIKTEEAQNCSLLQMPNYLKLKNTKATSIRRRA